MRTLEGNEKKARSIAIATGTAAVMCGVCCVLPLALPAVAIASAGGLIAWFARAQGWATLVAVVAIGIAWIWVARQTLTSKRRAAPATLYMMAASTALLAIALLWPIIEPHAIHALRT